MWDQEPSPVGVSQVINHVAGTLISVRADTEAQLLRQIVHWIVDGQLDSDLIIILVLLVKDVSNRNGATLII